MKAAKIGEKLTTWGGQFSATIASGVGTVTLKKSPGRLCRIFITSSGTAGISVFDNASAASGTALFVSPTITTLGQIFDIQMPAQLGITVSNPASGPGATISFN
jgi:hypothetical protein